MTATAGERPRVVLHLTECFASGTATAINQYARNLRGYEHVVLGALRAEAPATTEMSGPFRFVRLPRSKVAQAVALVRWARRLEPAVLHCHSSWAGLYGRPLGALLRIPVVYSPHGMSTYRRDVGPLRHALFWAAERLLSWCTDAYVVAGRHEARLVRSVAGRRAVFEAVPALAAPSAPQSERGAGRDVDLCTAARISPAKDPHLFVEVVRGLRARGWTGRGVWIGSGDDGVAADLEALGVTVTGWVDRAEVARLMARSRIYLDTSAWEASLSYADLEAARARSAALLAVDRNAVQARALDDAYRAARDGSAQDQGAQDQGAQNRGRHGRDVQGCDVQGRDVQSRRAQDRGALKVLHARVGPVGGGIEVFVKNLLETVDRDEFDLTLLSFSADHALKDEYDALGARVVVVPSPRHPVRHLRALRRLLAHGGFDAVHLHKNSAADLTLALVARAVPGLPLVVHAHSARTRPLRTPLHLVGRPLLRALATARVACSPVAGRWLFGRAAMASGQVGVVPNGVDLERFRRRPDVGAAVRAELGLGERFVVGHVGSFTYPKNHAFLLDVFAATRRTVPAAVLLLVGDGPLREEVITLVREKGLAEHVVLAGVRSDVDRLYQGMDVFLLPSRYEGYPLAAVEACAVGVPCVVSDPVAATFAPSLRSRFTALPLSDDVGRWAAVVVSAREAAPAGRAPATLDRRLTTAAIEQVYRRLDRRAAPVAGVPRTPSIPCPPGERDAPAEGSTGSTGSAGSAGSAGSTGSTGSTGSARTAGERHVPA